MRITSTLLAIDPTNCGCTECLVGDYVPLDRATTDQVQALFLGIISDHTSTTWTVTQLMGGKFTVAADDRQFTIDAIALPMTVDHYTVDLFPDTAAKHRHRLGVNPSDTSPAVIGAADSPLAHA